MRYKVDHSTHFHYSAPVAYSMLEVRLRPRNEGGQRCTHFKLTTSPPTKVFSYRDGLGNAVHHFDVTSSHTELKLVSEAVVEIDALPEPPVKLAATAWNDLDRLTRSGDFYDELSWSQYICETPLLLDLAAELGVAERSEDPLTLLRGLNTAIQRTFRYDQASTAVDSPIDVALASRGGVCQDYAHIMIALCRRLGIPAHYVSGYLFHRLDVKDQSAEDASHAWLEAYLPGLGWIGFDPTNDLLAADRHIRVAVGRDYADVTPVRGVLNGGGTSLLDVGVRVALAEPESMLVADDVIPRPVLARYDEPWMTQAQQQ